MPKKREKNADEFYRGKLREAQKQIRDLQRQVRALEKTSALREERRKDPKPKKDDILMCPDCGKGKLKVLEVIGKVFHICECCGYRKKIHG